MTSEHFSIARGDVVASVKFFLSRHTSVYQEVWAENCSWMSYAGLGLHKEFLNSEVCGSFCNTAKQTCMQCGEESVLEEHSTSLPPLGVSTWHSGWHQEELHFLRTYKNEVSGQVSRSSGSLLPGHILERCGHPSFSWRMLAKMTHIHSTLQFLVLGSDKAHAGWKASHVYSSLERDCWCLESWVRKWDNFFPETQEIMLVLPWFQSGVISS